MKIFVVDDDIVLRMIMVECLNDPRDTILEFSDGQDLLDAIDEEPDLILLDIEMPGLDGISACKKLRAQGHDHAQIIFVSSRDDLETRLTAYAAGARDFIVKPFDVEELFAKANIVREYLEKKAQSSSNFQYAQQTAFTAMSSLGELGIVMQFLRQSFECKDNDDLAANIFETLAQYGLEGVIELRTRQTSKAYARSGECTPLQHSILAHVQTLERIFRFSSQLSINYPNVTIVIMNLPADEERVGRLRDHLAVLAEGANARLQSLETAQIQVAQGNGIAHILVELNKTLHEIEQTQATTRLRSMEINNHYLQDLANAFITLGLADSQEDILTALAEKTNAELAQLRDIDGSTSDRLRAIREQLRTLIGQ